MTKLAESDVVPDTLTLLAETPAPETLTLVAPETKFAPVSVTLGVDPGEPVAGEIPLSVGATATGLLFIGGVFVGESLEPPQAAQKTVRKMTAQARTARGWARRTRGGVSIVHSRQ
ncbi:MAG TPA: hypothetical protein VK636_18230 [Gemmatimonadaceae bacterium]|nr:hypothetical protein [Gemmatimonadaceae bacterium]